MKRLIALIFTILSVIFVNTMFLGTAEAARVAVLPLQFSDDNMERISDFTSYYWDVMVEKFQYPDYELMDDEKIAAALHDEELKSFDKASLTKAADQTNAEIVVVMRLDKMEQKSNYFDFEPKAEFLMQGEYAGYNRLTDKYYHKKFFEKFSVEDVLTVKNDFQRQTFATLTKRFVYRTLK